MNVCNMLKLAQCKIETLSLQELQTMAAVTTVRTSYLNVAFRIKN